MTYSRLDTSDSKKVKTSIIATSSTSTALPKRSATTWFFNKSFPSLSTQNLSKSLNKLNKTEKKEEREWLLLEPSSPTVRQENQDEELNAESSILSDATTSDVDCIVKVDQLCSESSDEEDEDIDSIVEEFQQKLKVTTAGLKDTNLKIPSTTSWRCSLLCILAIIMASIMGGIACSYENVILFIVSLITMLIVNLVVLWIPTYTYAFATPSAFTCSFCIYTCSIFLAFITFDSWCAVVFWFVSGIVLALQSLVKCDLLCCLCLDYPHDESQATIVMEEHLVTNGSHQATIHLRNAPKGISMINRVQRHS